ncbi:MAG: Transporter, sodium/sulfate symporter family, partial [uncultured Rubellimicrobium sp.]
RPQSRHPHRRRGGPCGRHAFAGGHGRGHPAPRGGDEPRGHRPSHEPRVPAPSRAHRDRHARRRGGPVGHRGRAHRDPGAAGRGRGAGDALHRPGRGLRLHRRAAHGDALRDAGRGGGAGPFRRGGPDRGHDRAGDRELAADPSAVHHLCADFPADGASVEQRRGRGGDARGHRARADAGSRPEAGADPRDAGGVVRIRNAHRLSVQPSGLWAGGLPVLGLPADRHPAQPPVRRRGLPCDPALLRSL